MLQVLSSVDFFWLHLVLSFSVTKVDYQLYKKNQCGLLKHLTSSGKGAKGEGAEKSILTTCSIPPWLSKPLNLV